MDEALCNDKNPGEFFRLLAGDAHCQDVVACADHGLQAIRCPTGLAFDLRKQICDLRREVKDCNHNQKSRPTLSLPLARVFQGIFHWPISHFTMMTILSVLMEVMRISVNKK